MLPRQRAGAAAGRSGREDLDTGSTPTRARKKKKEKNWRPKKQTLVVPTQQCKSTSSIRPTTPPPLGRCALEMLGRAGGGVVSKPRHRLYLLWAPQFPARFHQCPACSPIIAGRFDSTYTHLIHVARTRCRGRIIWAACREPSKDFGYYARYNRHSA